MNRHTPKNTGPAVEPGGITIEARPWAEGTVLTLRGELDLDTVGSVEAALDAALAGPATVVVLDCGDLEFCDSTGLNAMLRARARAEAGGSRIELARPRPLVLRMLELTGATDAFRIRDGAPP
ncbi:STAS domain-containing protein [Streptomyces sp. CB01881]|uniref:STAS domain-containing protein n=1 Tax=Streptomyces sp. CB01881 TaxID=2078691 RepID=UPI000CDCB59A|nr:STAS domain-containing protein [Streptomyces sp. CB01881]AUY53379.1 metal ABC transporter substrate-binding protein [Streptomyces sp. CB01881]TYC69530.1 anti-sigma factor antagonist [Streptomyces sp. CB01881]